MSKKWIDKKHATSFALVHRSHEDPLYHDTEASEHVLKPMYNGNAKRSQKKETNIRLEGIDDLASQLQGESIRSNEGEAALYGVTFDDSKYDYMQHLKPIGTGSGGIFIAKDNNNEQQKPKDKDFFRDLEEILPSEEKVNLDYQDQQDIPDELRGFKPDMDPRLREVLEALEDDAYLDPTQDAEQGDIFEDLLQSGKAEVYNGEDFDEYDLDQYDDEFDDYDNDKEPATWEEDFKRFEKAQKSKKNEWDSDDDFDDDEEDEVPDLPQFGTASGAAVSGKRSKQKARRKKGAMTDTSSFSMSSSALFRTEGLRLLDDKYEQLLKKQQKEDDEEEEDYQEFDMSKERPDFEDMLDDFLDNYELDNGKKIVKKNEEKARIQKAALDASKGKATARKKKEEGLTEVEKTLKNLKLK